MTVDRVAGSFRDPCGFVFRHAGQVLRQINPVGREAYEMLMNSGLYQALNRAGLLLKHEEISDFESPAAYKIIKPEQLEFISYPWEWCFSQLKDAAMAMLQIQKVAFEHGMTLQDSSAFNIQFRNARPVMIDTLSFTPYREGDPWLAYRQFCQHFLAPLALMRCRDVRLLQLFRVYIDGLPLDLASRLLPWHSWLSFSLLTHIHLHSRSQSYYADKTVSKGRQAKMSRISLLGLIDSLESGIAALSLPHLATEWGNYYADTNYSAVALSHKQQVVNSMLERAEVSGVVWDFGANTGVFSRLASHRGLQTVSFDIDPVAVEKNYQQCRSANDECLLPLLLDLTNPSPSLGWENSERMSLIDRGPADTVLALALIHHLAISNNLPLGRLAEFFARVCCHLIIEFVPKTDSQVQHLLATREDIFIQYTQDDFEREFRASFSIIASEKISESERTLYLMKKL